jgi:hypothetical protein
MPRSAIVLAVLVAGMLGCRAAPARVADEVDWLGSPCRAPACVQDTSRYLPSTQPCAVIDTDTTGWLEYRSEFLPIRFYLPGKFRRLAGPGWELRRVTYERGDDIMVQLQLDSGARRPADDLVCIGCAERRDRATCTDTIAGRPTDLETGILVAEPLLNRIRARYYISAVIELERDVRLTYAAHTRYADLQRELLVALRRTRIGSPEQ